MPELNVVDIKGNKATSVDLPKEQFGVHVHDAVIHQALAGGVDILHAVGQMAEVPAA